MVQSQITGAGADVEKTDAHPAPVGVQPGVGEGGGPAAETDDFAPGRPGEWLWEMNQQLHEVTMFPSTQAMG